MRPDSFIYHVYVGISWREQAKAKLIEEFCKDNGMYFRKWSQTVDSGIQNAEKQFRSYGSPTSRPFNHAHVSVNDLYQMIIDDSFDRYEANFKPSKLSLLLHFHNSIPFTRYHNRFPSITTCPPHRRKNLSSGKLAESRVTIGAMIGILCLIILDTIVTNIFHLF